MIRSVVCLCCIALCLPGVSQGQSVATWQAERSELIEGIDQIALPGSVGSLCVFGSKAFPVATAVLEGGVRLPCIAVAQAGGGRVVACAHKAYVANDFKEDATARLMLRLVHWAANKPASPVKIGMLENFKSAAMLRRDGNEVTILPRDKWTGQLDDIEVIFLAGEDLKAEDVRPLQAYIAHGGAVVVADAAWVWKGYRRKPGETLYHDCMPNRLLAPIGISWTTGTLNRDASGGLQLQRPLSDNVHALGAVFAVGKEQLTTPAEMEQARVAIEQAMQVVPSNDRLLVPWLRKIRESTNTAKLKASLAQRGGLRDLKQRIAVGFETMAALHAAGDQINRSPLAAQFPGVVPEDEVAGDAAEILKTVVSIDSSVTRWHSTGVYAAPGETIYVRVAPSAVGAKLRLRIGAHKDRLWHLQSWERAPEITRDYPIVATQTKAACAFGGLVYIDVPSDCKLGKFDVTLHGGVASPRYIHNETTIAQWRSQRQNPAPWAEIGSDKIIFTVPSSRVRDLDRPDSLMTYWDTVLDACADLATIDHRRASPERFVTDAQISAGYMHAGYPIMAPLKLAGEVLDLETLNSKGNWGVFHEIGHNHQQSDWTYSGTGEVTVNLFTMYVFDTLHPTAAQSKHVSDEGIAKLSAQFDKTGVLDGPWMTLIPYIQLQREFGWDSFKNVFREYRQLKPAQRPKNDLEKRSQWMTRFSKQVGRDLSPLFDHWKIKVSDEAKKEIAHLPKWSP